MALKGVSLEVTEGEVHALVGENGAGKSTLMAVAAGSLLPDRGSVEIGGHVMEQPSPAAAQALGLAVVYQHLSILEDLTVAETMVFAMPRGRRPSLLRAGPWARKQLAVVGAASIDPSTRVSDLSVADRQLVEIAKALALEPKVLVLDEPTESLTPVESALLFDQVRKITAAGTAVVYISHRLPEVKRIADRITVLRDGETRGTVAAASVSEDEILRLIIGRAVDQAFPPKADLAGEGEPLLSVRGLSGPRFHDVDLDVRPRRDRRARRRRGQRAARVPARARRPLARDRQRHARRREGRPRRPRSRAARGDRAPPRRPPRRGRAAAPERAREPLPARAEIRRARGRGAAQARGRAGRGKQIRQLDVRTPGMETPISALSGGNQQKVLFARSLLAEPTLLLADEPTRGVDANARLELYQVMRRVAQAGQAVIVVSSDVVELQGLCDRVIVFSRGQAVRTLTGADITEEHITGAAITSDTQRAAHAASRRNRLQQWRRFGAGDYLPTAVLALLIGALTIYTAESNDFFLSKINFVGMLLLASALGFIAIGQLIVLLTGGIDLSVGPLTGLVVVVMSFFAGQGQSDGRFVLGILAVIGTALVVGLTNAALVRVVRLAPVLATLATYIVLQGISLLLRETPGGYYRPGVTSTIKTTIGWVPVAFLVVAGMALACEGALRFTRFGLALRAVGSDAVRAHRLGAHVTITQVSAYVLCSLFTAAGGIMLASQVAIGDPSVGLNYTLTSITAVVLGGASIFGGRGSFIGALFGAVLIQEIVTSTTFLQIGTEWQYYLPGILILAGAGVYSRTRQLGPSALAAPETAPTPAPN